MTTISHDVEFRRPELGEVLSICEVNGKLVARPLHARDESCQIILRPGDRFRLECLPERLASLLRSGTTENIVLVANLRFISLFDLTAPSLSLSCFIGEGSVRLVSTHIEPDVLDTYVSIVYLNLAKTFEVLSLRVFGIDLA